jgi:hypothetical protein
MERIVGSAFGSVAMGSMAINDRFTLISNAIAIAAVVAVAIAARPRKRIA